MSAKKLIWPVFEVGVIIPNGYFRLKPFQPKKAGDFVLSGLSWARILSVGDRQNPSAIYIRRKRKPAKGRVAK